MFPERISVKVDCLLPSMLTEDPVIQDNSITVYNSCAKIPLFNHTLTKVELTKALFNWLYVN